MPYINLLLMYIKKTHLDINFKPRFIVTPCYFIPQKYYCCVAQRFKQNHSKILQILQIFRMEKFKSSSIVGKNSGIATRTHGRVYIPGKRTHRPCPSLVVCMFTSARHLSSVLEFQVTK